MYPLTNSWIHAKVDCMNKVIEFMRELPHPSTWAKAHKIPPWLVSRLRHNRNSRISIQYINQIIEASNGQLTVADFTFPNDDAL